MRWGVLGPLFAVEDRGREISLPTGRQRVALAALLMRANRVVSVDELVELVWDGRPPSAATRSVRVYFVRLRRTMGPGAGGRIVTEAPGYLCRVDADELDLFRFETLCRAGFAAVQAGHWSRAAAVLGDALALWRGAPLADVPSDLLREQHVPRLEQLRMQAYEKHAEAELRLGHEERLVPQLRELAASHPMNERIHALWMIALARTGRRAQALASYHETRKALIEELGIEPGPELSTLYGQILAGSPAPSTGLTVDIDETAPGVAASGSAQSSASAWASVMQKLNTLPVADHVELLTELHRRFHDGVMGACVEAVGDLPPGHRRLVAGTFAYLDASRREPSVRRVLTSARVEQAIRGEVAKRNIQMSEVITSDFVQMGYSNPSHMARLWVGMAAEVALAESAEDAELPELRGALIDYLGRWRNKQ